MSSGLERDLKENGMSVLIVEDDSIQSFALEVMVRNLNFKVLGVSRSGEHAIQMSAEMDPDIILMDINLDGEMDGIEAAIKIQKTSNAKLIYVTGNSKVHYNNSNANKTRYVDYLEKPVNKEILSKALHKCFEQNIEISSESKISE